MSRSNKDRSDTTRLQLLDAARTLFVEKGYAETATPDIVAAAGVTRGALYHHFADKKALFAALVEREAGEVAHAIEASATPDGDPGQALIDGIGRYFDAMAHPGRVRLLLLDGPAILGPQRMREIDGGAAEASLLQGLSDRFAAEARPRDIAPLAHLLSAAFDRAALEIDAGGDRSAYEAAITRLIGSLDEGPAA